MLAAFWSEPIREPEEVLALSTAAVARWTILSSRAIPGYPGKCQIRWILKRGTVPH